MIRLLCFLKRLLPISLLSLLPMYKSNDVPYIIKQTEKVGQPQIIVLMINTLRHNFNTVC